VRRPASGRKVLVLRNAVGRDALRRHRWGIGDESVAKLTGPERVTETAARSGLGGIFRSHAVFATAIQAVLSRRVIASSASQEQELIRYPVENRNFAYKGCCTYWHPAP
jgi:hypothetical protein